MSDLGKRLAKLEATTGKDDGYCQCQNKWTHIDYRDGIIEPEDGPRPPIICDRCGKEKHVIEVRLTTFAYGNGPDVLQTDADGKAVFDYDAA